MLIDVKFVAIALNDISILKATILLNCNNCVVEIAYCLEGVVALLVVTTVSL